MLQSMGLKDMIQQLNNSNTTVGRANEINRGTSKSWNQAKDVHCQKSWPHSRGAPQLLPSDLSGVPLANHPDTKGQGSLIAALGGSKPPRAQTKREKDGGTDPGGMVKNFATWPYSLLMVTWQE